MKQKLGQAVKGKKLCGIMTLNEIWEQYCKQPEREMREEERNKVIEMKGDR